MFHVEHEIKMKKFIILFSVSITLQSCFYTHRARKIEAYEIDHNKKEALSTFVFEYPGKEKDFEKQSISFFKIELPYMPLNFTTKQLFPDENLNVFIYTSKEKDVMVNLLGFMIRQALDTDNDRLEDKNEDPNPDTTYYHYVHIQITDMDGNDVLSQSTMKSKAVINKLLRYKNYLN